MARSDRSAVAKALDLLSALADAEGPLRLSELAERVGLHRATAYRSLAELIARNFVVRDENDRYMLGWALLRMTQGPAARHALADTARPMLSRLAAETERIAGVEVLEEGGCRVIETVRPERYQRFLGFGGEVFDPWRSASGLVLLAFSDTGRQESFLDSAVEAGEGGAQLRAQLRAVCREGYAFSSGGLDPLIADVAVPVRGAGGYCRAAVSVTGFVHDFDDEAVSRARHAAATAARALENLLDDSEAEGQRVS
ncbi:IclR family transcriptional regulator [Haloechinothrix sp. LS1_15]|uniref:IclR family transcriptional regulator n=1 Tax=Haloechinothrix sp. LS1_15 TaxID=2652248 RepID=UPI0029489424|nr:IclR family transcriptional regulator [Haloechinothrix sp. LS1_15]MDV6011891.1 IclR family transcriptional regulator [Haloechinothrix sp. LS1_15]